MGASTDQALAGDQTAAGAVDLARLPRHVAIIMDGNGRWAKARGLPRTMGHRSGVEAVRRTVRAVGEMGIPFLTLYGFSSENWSRPVSEIDDLMMLLKRFVRQDLADLHRNNVRIRVIGDEERLDEEILSLMAEAQRLTADNTGLQLVAAFNYGSRGEIARAARRITERALAGALAPEDVTAEEFCRHLDTAGIPDPDLLIRTSGEQRLSNFLLWQCAYAELVFTDVLWPDFGPAALREAISVYQSRERRFGGVSARSAL